MSSRIIAEIDYEKDGKQVGWLGLPHSVTRSAYGKIMIPIAVIRNGKGPTVFFQAGNHGDEYEGQIALVKLIRELDPAAIQGRVIVLPAANFPAAMAGTRVSPIDEGNLNRAFPGESRRHGDAADRAITSIRCCSRRRTCSTTCTPAARRCNTCRSRACTRAADAALNAECWRRWRRSPSTSR